MLHQETQAWTIRDLMKFSIDHLQRHGFDEARLAVELLLSHALHCQRIELYTHFEKPLSKDELKQFRSLFERRLNHEPVQYIVGTTAFMGLHLRVDPRVFIPRPETETLVEQVMLLCNQRKADETLSILEIGTGSGNIAVALAKLIRDVEVTSIDTSGEALEVARGNATLQGVAERISFQQMSVFDSSMEKLTVRFDQLVSNPPYVSVEEWEHLEPEIRRFEPRGAVSDSGDGYEFFRRITSIARGVLKKEGHVIVEVGEGQAEKVQGLFRDANLSDVRAVNDLQDVPRVVIGVCH
jgi:release factor glutamine methyltransferase